MSYPSPGKAKCPFCQGEVSCDEVDIGVGYVQCGPYYCPDCEASQFGPEAPSRFRAEEYRRWGQLNGLTEEELQAGFYRGRHSPYANTVLGSLVDHKTAKIVYEAGFLDKKPEATDEES